MTRALAADQLRPVSAAILVVAIAFLAAGGALGPARAARADATITESKVEIAFPKAIIFTLAATAPTEIRDVTLSYTVAGGNSAIVKPEEFSPGVNVSLTAEIETNPDTDWLPAGSQITWQWEISLADGTTTKSEPKPLLFLPPNREWKTVTNDIVTVYYSSSRDTIPVAAAAAAKATYETVGKGLLNTELPRKPVKVVIFGDANELREATPSKGSTFDTSRAVVTCGVRPGSANDLILSTVSCGGSDPIDTIRHEFGHIINAAAGESALVRLPVWMDEGLAVFAQDKADDYSAAFQAAARRSNLIPFREMDTQIADQNKVILQYGQSFAMVAYLIDKYGPAKLQELLKKTKANTRFDQALQQTYGFDIDGFEREFKAAVGTGGSPTAAPTRAQQQATASPTPRQQGATPTPRPTQPGAPATGDSDDDGLSKGTIALVGAAIVLALAGAMTFLVSMMLSNQRRPRA
ncbi:MAG: peptidase MA family metallohydrolase [Dehalococcoidia bacterium]